jgi:predicted CoA-binding protein
MPGTSRASIDAFLSLRRIAFAGLSRNPKHFSRALFHEFRVRGYTALPVNPQAEEIESIPCAPKVSAIDPAPEGVLVMTPAHASAEVVEDAARAGVRHVWLYRALGEGAVSSRALDIASAHMMQVVAGECPWMFLPQSGFPHNVHRGFRSLVGSLPR